MALRSRQRLSGCAIDIQIGDAIYMHIVGCVYVRPKFPCVALRGFQSPGIFHYMGKPICLFLYWLLAFGGMKDMINTYSPKFP